MRGLNLAGLTFGRLKVIKQAGRQRKAILWECLCSCGDTTVVRASHLMAEHTRSCGCLQREVVSGERTHMKINSGSVPTLTESDGDCVA
jgi:hypothetical protein